MSLSRSEIKEIRRDFKFLELEDKNIYFDSAATSQKPEPVIQAVDDYYRYDNGNPNRGAHYFASQATQVHEEARDRLASFIGADHDEILFTRNATEALNLLAYSWGLNNLKEGDEILISILEHHANLVTWQYVAQKTGAKLVYIYLDEDMQVSREDFEKKMGPRTRLFSITGSSNTLGTIPPVKAMIARAREVNPEVLTIVDGAQLVPHHRVDVKDLDCDFLALSGHKMFAYMGIGALYGKKEALKDLPPFLYGGEMIEYVTEQETTFLDLPRRFEAGTVDVGGARSLTAAIDYMEALGMDKMEEYEKDLTDYAYSRMVDLPYLEVYTGPGDRRAPLVAFNFKEIHPHDVGTILGSEGVAIRTGHHCTQPLHRYLGINASCRVSFSVYNTIEEIDIFIDKLEKVRKVMGLGS